MKRTILFFMTLSILNFLAGCSGTAFYPYGYSIHGNKVFYKFPFPQGATELEHADAATFKIVADGADSNIADGRLFAYDKNSAWYSGYKIEGSDGKTFKLLHPYYSKDKAHCYFRSTMIEGADPATFKIETDEYTRDANHVFRFANIIENDGSVFETFDSSSIIHTKNAVSVYDKIVAIPAGATFQHLDYNYFAIDGQIYSFTDPLHDDDVKNFVALNKFTSLTKKHVYYGDKIIEDADPASFRLLDEPYSRDDHHIFFFEKKIDGADVKTFEIINTSFQCARDKNAVYHQAKKVTNFTKEDLANKKPCRQCNEERVFFE